MYPCHIPRNSLPSRPAGCPGHLTAAFRFRKTQRNRLRHLPEKRRPDQPGSFTRNPAPPTRSCRRMIPDWLYFTLFGSICEYFETISRIFNIAAIFSGSFCRLFTEQAFEKFDTFHETHENLFRVHKNTPSVARVTLGSFDFQNHRYETDAQECSDFRASRRRPERKILR